MKDSKIHKADNAPHKLTRCCQFNKYFHVDENNEPAYSQRYDLICDFSEGLAPAGEHFKWFHITPDGKPAYEERYDAVGNFHKGKAKVQKGNEIFYINKNGKRIWSKNDYKRVADFNQGLACAECVDGKWCHVNERYEPIYQERYDYVGSFYNGLAQAELDGKYFHITPDGKPAYRKRYDMVGNFCEGLAKVWKGNEVFDIDKNGKRMGETK